MSKLKYLFEAMVLFGSMVTGVMFCVATDLPGELAIVPAAAVYSLIRGAVGLVVIGVKK